MSEPKMGDIGFQLGSPGEGTAEPASHVRQSGERV